MTMDAVVLHALILACAPQVHPSTAQALVAVESGRNPNAIGVVGGSLERQPRNQVEAIATVRKLHKDGWNYSVGLAQINARNFRRLGLDQTSALDPCLNLGAMQTVLRECFDRAGLKAEPQPALHQALSCYYSGNFVTGFHHGYVERVARQATPRPAPPPPQP
jgi:type IV secretion system protein VirB1